MPELLHLIDSYARKYGIEDKQFRLNLTSFFVSNMWFGVEPQQTDDGQLNITEAQCKRMSPHIDEFCRFYGCSAGEKKQILSEKLKNLLPETAQIFSRYCTSNRLDVAMENRLLDFILYYMPGELRTLSDQEIATLLLDGHQNLPKAFGDLLADFINWSRHHYKTCYQKDYFMMSYGTKKTDAYDPNSYLKIMYYMYNEGYITENDMYQKAAQSKNYVDTWLFISLHFICSLRNTDLTRLPHPVLPLPPNDILFQVEHGQFEPRMARLALQSVIQQIDFMGITPNKTRNVSGVSTIKFSIPVSVEVHIGTLFAVAEAFFQLRGLPPSEPLIRVISTYEQISRYMGEEIGDLFLESNFQSRAANKSYMQMVYVLTDEILENNDEFRVKGYILAALARSHKGDYGEFAATTSVYLQDAKMSGYSAEFVARELFERGVLSFIPSTLLKMLAGDTYQKLSLSEQTSAIKALNLTPAEVETNVRLAQATLKRSVEIATSLYHTSSQEEILKILHRIGNGEAVSKQNGTLCLATACLKMCPYPDRSGCIGCQYEISTKSTLWLMVQEVNRLKDLYRRTSKDSLRMKYRTILKDVISPAINEMLKCIEETYGTQMLMEYETIIREASYG